MTDRRPPGGRILLRVPHGLHGELRSRAQSEGVSLNQYLVSLLSRAVGAPPGEEASRVDNALVQEVHGLVEQLEARIDDLEQILRRFRAEDLARISDLERAVLRAGKGRVAEAGEGIFEGLKADVFASDSPVHQELREQQALWKRIAERGRRPEPQVDDS